MTIPDFQSLMRPVLASLADGEIRRSRDVKDSMADEFRLTDEERAHMLPSGRARTMDNRVGWALTYLRQAGLVDAPSRGRVRINTVGREALDRFAERIDMKALEAYPAYLEFRDRTRDTSTKKPGRAPGLAPELAETPATPQELVEQAVATNRAAVEGDVLRSALALTPTGFEELVLRLLTAMGYGEDNPIADNATEEGKQANRRIEFAVQLPNGG